VPLVLLSFLSTAVALAQPYLTKLLIDDAILHRSMRGLELFALWMGICAVLSLALGALTTYLYTKLSALVLFDMRLTAFRKLQTLSPQFYARTKTGDIVSRLNNDIGELQKLSSDTLLSLPSNVLFLAGNAAMMCYLNPRLAAIGFALLPAGIWAMRRYQGRLRSQVQVLRESSSEIGSFLIEALLGMRLLVSSNAQERKNREFSGLNDRFVGGLLAMQITAFLASGLPGLVITSSVAVLFLYGGHLVISGVITLGSLMAFMAYHGRLLSPVQGLMGSYSALISGSVSLRRVFELLDQKPEVLERPDPIDALVAAGAIEFKNVTFRYQERDPVLRNLSFFVPAKTACVIVGESGAGKSTVIDLILRFYDPESGAILLDGAELSQMRLDCVRSAVTVVEQLPFFFHASLLENLRFARPEASVEEIEDAVRRAGIDGFIHSLPLGYETILGERGLMLSAGQRQRLAIARGLLRNPAALILDEPSAALDPTSEFALGETLKKLTSSCTVLVVTHRPALLQIADQVIVLENGQVVESGPPQALSDPYSALARHFREVPAL
jgi:ATP-binding cassette subfamily B protein